ncbi:MAG: hypothetical protein JXR83_14735 [Deltaproteobacteria bacterium]|nr:hypothetical protein [Deltaproteobacteria bacterium]
MNRSATAMALLTALVACGGPNYPDWDGSGELPSASGGAGANGVGCRPDLDGVIADSELASAIGATVRYFVSTGERQVDVEGAAIEAMRVWDLSLVEDSDRLLAVTALPTSGAWFADRIAQADHTYLVPLDADGALLGIMQRRPGALAALGSASAEPDPPAGQTLLIYDAPVDLFRLPLGVGDGWTSEALITDGKVQGLPIAARQTWRVEALREGQLVLPDLTFERVLQVALFIHQEAIVGPPTDWVQISFLAECYGEVARFTSPLGVTSASFDTASEVRRLGF